VLDELAYVLQRGMRQGRVYKTKSEQLVAQSMKTTSIQKMNNILKVFVFDRDIWGILGLTLVLVQSLIYHLPQPLFVLAPHLVVQQSTCAVPCGHGML
jgi:hypothetical protein